MARFVPIIIQVTDKDGDRVVQKITNAFKQLPGEAERSAKGSSNAFTQYLGADFFGGLARQAFNFFRQEAQKFVTDSVRLAQEIQNALKGVGSISDFYGLPSGEAQKRISELDAVKLGFLSIADATRSVKPLLQFFRGDMEKAIEITDIYSKTAVFGRQAALAYGEAIVSASEGLKNLNPITSDNAGITKNWSIIMKEAGFELQDLDDKQKGLAAREALVTGLRRESLGQMGDLVKGADTYTGVITVQDKAYQDLQRSIGEIIITNPSLIESNKIVTEQIIDTTGAIVNQGEEAQRTARQMINAYALVKANFIPLVAFLKNLVVVAGETLGTIITATVGGLLRLLENILNGIERTITGVINSAISGVNTIGSRIGLPEIPLRTPSAPVNLGAQFFIDRMNESIKDLNQATRNLADVEKERAANVKRVREASFVGTGQGSSALADRGMERVNRAQEIAEGLRNAEGKGSAAKAERAARDREIISSMRSTISDLATDFKEEFGRALPMNFGQTGLHTKLNYDHRAAADISIDARTPEGRFVMEWLKENGINARASFGREISSRTGKLISTGTHIHAGELSGAMGRGLARREGLLTSATLEERQAEWADRLTRMVASPFGLLPPSVSKQFGMEAIARKRAEIPLETIEYDPDAMKLPVDLERTWENYYKETEAREIALRDRRQDYMAEFLSGQRNMMVDIGNLELDLQQLRMQAADDQFSEQRRLLAAKGEEVDLTRQIMQAQDDLANGPLNESLRIQLALLHDIHDIRRRDEEAMKDKNRAELELADATIYHAVRADAAVLRFLASQRSVTEVIADAKVGVIQTTFDLIDQGLDKFTSKLGVIGSLVKELLSGFIRIALSKFFQSLYGGGAGTAGVSPASGAGGGVGGGIGGFIRNIFGNVFGGGGPGATASSPTAPGGTWAQFGNALPGITVPPSLSSQNASQSAIQSVIQQARGAAAPAGLNLGSLVSALPMLGVAFGAQTWLGILSGQRMSPVQAALGGGILGFLLNRNRARRQDEESRNAAMLNALGQLDEIIRAVKSDKMDAIAGTAAAMQVRSQYVTDMTALKDSKTRRIALSDVYRLDLKIDEIKKAGTGQDRRRDIEKRLVPEFAHGGTVPYGNTMFSMMTGLTPIKVRPGEVMIPPGGFGMTVPGVDRGYDSVYTMAPPRTRVLTKSQASSARGFDRGGTVGGFGGEGGPLEVHVHLSNQLVVGKETAGEVVSLGATTSDGRTAIVKVHKSYQLNGN